MRQVEKLIVYGPMLSGFIAITMLTSVLMSLSGQSHRVTASTLTGPKVDARIDSRPVQEKRSFAVLMPNEQGEASAVLATAVLMSGGMQ